VFFFFFFLMGPTDLRFKSNTTSAQLQSTGSYNEERIKSQEKNETKKRRRWQQKLFNIEQEG